MKKTNQKKEWVAPELVVIVKCRPEESVLFACKTNAWVCGREGGGPSSKIVNS